MLEDMTAAKARELYEPPICSLEETLRLIAGCARTLNSCRVLAVQEGVVNELQRRGFECDVQPIGGLMIRW